MGGDPVGFRGAPISVGTEQSDTDQLGGLERSAEGYRGIPPLDLSDRGRGHTDSLGKFVDRPAAFLAPQSHLGTEQA